MTTQSDSKNPVASPRKGHKTGVVCELSVFLKVKPGHEKQIREVFTSIAATDTADQGALSHKVLESVGTLHESRQGRQCLGSCSTKRRADRLVS